jgi:hypothetical protein
MYRTTAIGPWSMVALAALVLAGCAREGQAPPSATPEPSAGGPPTGNLSAPVQVTTAVTPKPLSDEVQKGLAYLAKQQHANGGWGQGGGWRTSGQGRVEGAEVQDPPDVGNTCMATLALVRAGNTATSGPCADNVARALDFLCKHVEKADDKSLFVTDVRDTQLQSKIGPYVDTFLTALLFAELKGRVGEQELENRMVAALDRTLAKIQRNQADDGRFAGNTGWASVLSQGLAGKALSRAKLAGADVSEETIAKVQKQVASSFDGRSGTFRMAGAGEDAARSSDAGVSLYGTAAGLGNAQDVVTANGAAEKKARDTLARATAPTAERARAQTELKRIEEAKKLNDEAQVAVVRQLDNPDFVAGFGSNGGEEFLSFLNISEALLSKGGAEWQKWDKAVGESLNRAQDKDGSWSGQHCITGKTFCTAGALLVLMADRTPVAQVAKMEEKK